MNIVLYSTNCPKCKVLTAKLNSKNIQYTVNTDTEYMQTIGLNSVPYLEIDGELFNFVDAVQWVNQQ